VINRNIEELGLSEERVFEAIKKTTFLQNEVKKVNKT